MFYEIRTSIYYLSEKSTFIPTLYDIPLTPQQRLESFIHSCCLKYYSSFTYNYTQSVPRKTPVIVFQFHGNQFKRERMRCRRRSSLLKTPLKSLFVEELAEMDRLVIWLTPRCLKLTFCVVFYLLKALMIACYFTGLVLVFCAKPGGYVEILFEAAVAKSRPIIATIWSLIRLLQNTQTNMTSVSNQIVSSSMEAARCIPEAIKTWSRDTYQWSW